MKKIKIFLLAVSMSFVSCDAWLDLEPEFVQDAENFFLTPEDYERAVIGVYDLMQANYLHLWIGEIASDNSIAGGESVNDTQGLHEIDGMRHGGINAELRNVMRFNYAGIGRANFVFENEDNIDFPQKERLMAEISFIRAYYYFTLVKYFGDIPLIVDRRASINEVFQLDRTPRAQVYAQIEQDLDRAIQVLNWTNPELGRITKGAAMALKGKVLLYQNKFGEAAQVLGDLITTNEAGYALVPNMSTMWLAVNQNSSEDVFTIQHSGLQGGDYGCLVCLQGNPAPGFHAIRNYVGPFYGDGNSYNLPTQNLYDFFGNDPRRDVTILDLEAFIAGQPNASDITFAIGAGGHTGYFNNKYIKRDAERGLPDDDLTSPLNYRAIRYADVLLMAAEAFAQTGNDARARTELNKVRQRAGVADITSAGTQLLEDIYRERRLELSGEGYRFWDLVRTGKASEAIQGFQVGKHELFPIPQVEIDLAGGRWSQNPGY
ncbi:RagB/SusD family nutrient uptake outer membrane protein [Mongoliitalea daihaiensis]|uniref:RagB/SusD family nutrient uptake outer membrane protein n=1 Tax=Mongoliitalea daihaiensis TaxID=2782006 RepID=UPI001F467F8D|nr:RagB/SusD family nutrient uptake outer membrane protein [Mongoliitalea daihaiensis]UJP63754.1 RagB/SusD family nutrient uptake outer membrane protein [Mongoliitalea daihaiensis]